ncbi:aromatic amino acid hydroxylase [Pseudalkalibacillus berkeleyi]|uniref:Aromatic amino acid hydroxylase n=1 Tax=Pseudalkalibacillus berkeleyi TaxID=1069813 RepID=A0ABS9H0Z5_9BACL|nr:aromatic amino acid hydroxylase [Pseudalkalibacillus berkeleyi]MCF6138677.1 aromatic amino acid hydroxylase [Pseudalkalibacillus berkeleyi]
MMKQRPLPAHLRKYVVEQHHEQYSPIDHSVWRYVMRQNHNFLKDVAHEAYTDGLVSSGIKIDSIPKVDDMNESLKPFGWGAVTIDGFIPAVMFFDFQAHGYLPIATDIRKLENIDYTPAPDIIHEAAGHAPILCDSTYAEFVKKFGEIGSKALATKEEHELFDAIRTLSALLEDGSVPEQDIEAARANFKEKQEAVTEISEAEQISRLYWWTVEFGMIGSVEKPVLYGAGLLSSIGESVSSLSEEVTKLPFELDTVINTGFDITTQQPQLFVCKNFDQLLDAVEQFSETMAFKVGGTESLEKAVRSANTSTSVFSSGLQVTGTVSELIKDDDGEAIFMKTSGPTALSVDDEVIDGHGKNVHTEGFSSPIGDVVTSEKALEDWTEAEFSEQGIQVDEAFTLEFQSGVMVEGILDHVVRKNDKVILIGIKNAQVSHNGSVLFESGEGVFDMAVGTEITSVFAGAADSEHFFGGDVNEEVAHVEERELTPLEQLYGKIRKIREEEQTPQEIIATINHVVQELESFPEDWLLRLEIVEILTQKPLLPTTKHKLMSDLEQMKHQPKLKKWIDNGLHLIKVRKSA